MSASLMGFLEVVWTWLYTELSDDNKSNGVRVLVIVVQVNLKQYALFSNVYAYCIPHYMCGYKSFESTLENRLMGS